MPYVPPDFRAGVRDTLPLLVGFVPFSLVAGVAAVNVGLSPAQAVGLSVFVFAGASQLAVIDLLGRGAPLSVVVFTAVVINLRMMMYSASIAPYFQRLRTRWKAFLSYFLTDHSYALSLAEYASEGSTDRRWYYLGTALSAWVVWQTGTVTGAVLGASVPESWGLSFAVPLVFLALLVPTLTDRAAVAAAAAGGAVAVLATDLPFDLGLLTGALAGVLVGRAAEAALDVDPAHDATPDPVDETDGVGTGSDARTDGGPATDGTRTGPEADDGGRGGGGN